MNLTDLNNRSIEIHNGNIKAGWWTDIATGESIIETRNRPEIMMLVVTELWEAVDGLLDDAADDKLPQYDMVDVEIADAAIRLHDILGAEGIVITEDDVVVAKKAIDDYLNRIEMLYEADNLLDDIFGIAGFVCNAMEGYRKRTKPQFAEAYRTGLINALVACYLIADSWDLKMEAALVDKLNYNAVREDHKIENRKQDGGKSC